LTAVTPMLSYLVCATPRSGSTPLCHALDQTGVAGRPEEYFEALRQSGLPRRPHEYFDPLGHANIVERLAFRQMPDGSGRPNTLWHPDTYDRYLQWALEKGITANGVFGAKLMWGYLGDFAQLLRGINGMAVRAVPDLLGLGYEPLKVTYEELADSTEAVVRRVLEHLGIPAPDDLVIRTPRLSVQADEASEGWVACVHEHLAALEVPEPV
jgi:LPS sulfotransferase NodH